MGGLDPPIQGRADRSEFAALDGRLKGGHGVGGASPKTLQNDSRETVDDSASRLDSWIHVKHWPQKSCTRVPKRGEYEGSPLIWVKGESPYRAANGTTLNCTTPRSALCLWFNFEI